MTRAVVSAVVTGGLLLATLGMGIFFSLPSNVVSTRDGGALRSFVARFLPENWAFFTKPPNDPEIVPYVLGRDGWEYASHLPNSRAENWFGLRRSQRSQGPELANLANDPSVVWTDCGEIDEDCLAYAQRALVGTAPKVKNTAPVPTACGPVILVETRPVPWDFRKDYDGWRLDSRVTVVEAACMP